MRRRIADVRGRIAAAAARAGRDPGSVTLVAVSKGRPVDAVRAAIDAGVTDLGENRIQEAVPKIEAIGPGVSWHLVGSLQANKARAAVGNFDLVHSLDRLALARAMSVRATAAGRTCATLVQVNVTAKATQGGVAPGDLPLLVREAGALPGIALHGLMCIAPDATDADGPERARLAFREVATWFRALASTVRAAGHPWHHLSMGMTGDFEIAIEEGATIVRVGRAVFEDRST